VHRFAAIVIFGALLVPTAIASSPTSPLLQRASTLTGLKVRRAVAIVREPASRFEQDATRTLDQNYPPSLQRLDDELYMGLGLLPAQKSIRSAIVASASAMRARYDPSSRKVRARRSPAPARPELLRELARALVDQNFNLRRLKGLRARDRDAALAAVSVVDGIAAVASGARVPPLHGPPLQRFLDVEQNAGLEFGRNLIAQLRYLGGRSAVATALRSFPRTTAQVVQVDKFLQHEPAVGIPLAAAAGDAQLTASETFGELDVLALLRAYDVTDADAVATGWSGGRIALYTGPNGSAVALVLRWQGDEEAARWRASVAGYVGAAFPDATPRLCPAVTACWLDGTRELAVADTGTTTVFTSGVNAELLAAIIVSGK